MSLILAVEPDRRRGRQLASIVRKFTTAEIVVAQSGAAAVSAIGKRVPDLILTPALMPTQDETVINGWLRELGDAAAHVQTLDVPILAESAEAMTREQGSILGRLLDRNESGGTGHGCEPSVFADQIKVYLDRAAAERSARKEPDRAAAPAETPAIEAVASKDEEDAIKQDFEFEEISLDSLVLEPLFIDPPAPAPAADRPEQPVSETRAKADATPRKEKPRDPSATKAWEKELGLGGSPTSPALWRVAEGLPDAPPADDVPGHDDWAYFDPSQTRFKALVRRLDEIVAQHAGQV